MSYRRRYPYGRPMRLRRRDPALHGLGLVAVPDDEGALPEDVPVENGPRVIDFEEPEGQQEEITTESWMLSSTVAQQIFSIVPGVAGGLAGFILALKLANTKKVKASEVLLASGVVALTTFSVIFMVRTVEE
jgi:hypothetical protein